MCFDRYDIGAFYDEMFDTQGQPRPGTELLARKMASLPPEELMRRQKAAEKALLHLGITFNVYGDASGAERIFPFDIVPRIIPAQEWHGLSAGLRQRVEALNLFIGDVYGAQRILKAGGVPQELVLGAAGYRPLCAGLKPPRDIWCHITGTDLVRDRDGQYYVLEDNLRCPSGASYMLENRVVMKRTLPQVFDSCRVLPVTEYPGRLLEMLQDLSPRDDLEPVVVLWTPGPHNAAYFEHSFLAQQMGVQLVEGGDLVAVDGSLCMRTTRGLQRVDVIYRRLDDDFIDPLAFRRDSLLGVPGLMELYRAGKVALANAPGTGVADDKAIYAYVPEMIRYYLGEEPLIPNVPTYICWREKDREYVLAHLEDLVVKAVNASGGYGMLIGPASSAAQREEFAALIQANPRDYIAQPTLALSRVPVLVGDHFEGRHVDLRPFILCGREIYVLPGGLTRVALEKGSLVVNSSRGGGSKDTWVLESDGVAPPQGGTPC